MHSTKQLSDAVEVWWSSEADPGKLKWFEGPRDIPYRLSRQPDIALTLPQATETTRITITPSHAGQQILGMGTSMEETTISNLARMSPARREEVLRLLVDEESGIGLNLIRITLGTSDFTGQTFYTYNDMPEGVTDFEQRYFSIEKDVGLGIVETIQQLIALAPQVGMLPPPGVRQPG